LAKKDVSRPKGLAAHSDDLARISGFSTMRSAGICWHQKTMA
jgi:hypothetical protein